MREIRYCAPAVHHRGEAERKIEYIYDVISIQLARRCDLTVEQAGKAEPTNHSEYWLVELGASRRLVTPVVIKGTRSFPLRLTGAANMFATQNWSDLPARYGSLIGKS